MRRRTTRFSPPDLELTPELRWLLLAAFGPASVSRGWPPDAAKTVALARAFDLVPRLVGRLGPAPLETALGTDLSWSLRREALLALAQHERLTGAIEALDRAAGERRVPLAFLKFAALSLGGHVTPGQRRASDVDVLVAEEHLEGFASALVGDGWRRPAAPAYDHQLPPLVHPTHGAVELHRHVVGLDIAGSGRFAHFPDLDRAGLLEPAPGLGPQSRVPARDVLVAHALAHGLAQHGLAPGSYPAFRMLADLVDLGASTKDLAAAPGLRRWLSRTLTAGELEGALLLAERLASGTLPGPGRMDPATADVTLLSHLVAGRLDPGYAGSLRLAQILRSPSERPAVLAVASRLADAVFPGRTALELRHGSAVGAWGLLRLQVRRVATVCRTLLRLARARLDRSRKGGGRRDGLVGQ